MSDFLEGDTYLTELREESKQHSYRKVKQASKKAKSFHEELLNLQRDQIKMLGMLEKKQTGFQREMLKKQLEAEAKEKEKDREFLFFEKMLKNEK